MRLKTAFTIALALACALSISAPTFSFAEAKVGEIAPAFTLKSHEGKEHSLSDFKGKFVVLEWLNPECPYVKKHYNTGNMQKLQKTYTGKEVVWLSINSSAAGKQGHLTSDSASKFVADSKAAPTAVLFDHSGATGKAYGAKTTPHMFVINPEGTVIYAGAIDDNDSTRESSVENAKNFVAAALDEALAGKNVTLARTDPYGCSVKYAA